MLGIDVPCPNCGEKHSVLFREAKTYSDFQFTCINCGSRVTVKKEMPAVLEDLENQIRGTVSEGLRASSVLDIKGRSATANVSPN